MKIYQYIKTYYLHLLMVGFALSFLSTIVHYQNLKGEVVILNKELDSLQSVKDSLHEINFMNEVNFNRYDMTLEHFKEVKPSLAKEFEDYLSDQTE